jgi:hypothetical protein
MAFMYLVFVAIARSYIYRHHIRWNFTVASEDASKTLGTMTVQYRLLRLISGAVLEPSLLLAFNNQISQQYLRDWILSILNRNLLM